MTSPGPTRDQARRRRIGVALLLLVMIGTGVSLALSRLLGPSPVATAGGRPTEPASSAHPTDGSPAVVPGELNAWLAWVPGGFPSGFADRIERHPAFTETAVVAGDTLWMTVSRAADGTVVDRPERPFRIPIDAFSVDPDRLAPFLPIAEERAIIEALRAGKAVLGDTSARLRRLSPGGTISFEGGTVEVGAVAPDQLVGWSEVLVPSDVGAALGIEHDRYVLALADAMTIPRFRAIVRSRLPARTYLRVERPGGTPYVRVASGVNPPVVMKSVFGEFAATPRADDPAFFITDPAWYDANITTRAVPILGRVTCHRDLFRPLVGALRELVDSGLDTSIRIYSGCYASRTVGRSATAPPSQHAYGAAIDIDAPTNAMGDRTPAMDPRVVEIFERWGFNWGGRFVITDGMHFEYGSPPET